MKRWKKGAAVCLSLLLLIPAGAGWADELQDRLDSVKSQMETEQANIDYAKQQVKNISVRLEQLQKEMEMTHAEYLQIQSDLTLTKEKIAENERILAEAEQRLAQKMVVLKKRLRDIYINGKVNYLDVLIGAKDFSDFTTRMELLSRIASRDASLVREVQAQRALILEKKEQLEADRNRLEELGLRAEENLRYLEVTKAEEQALLERTQKEQAAAEQSYQELLAQSEEIEAMVRQKQQSASSSYSQPVYGSGVFIWPLTSDYVTSEYGWRTHPIFGTTRYHSGIDIGADYGEAIWAADGGVVIHSGWLGGYGKTIIIDHGNGLSSLYAHNSSLAVSEGEYVARGQVVAYAGSTGYSTGPHLHFEVRHYGEPVNPYNYL